MKRARTARESPTLLQNTFVPTMSTDTQVDPEKRMLIRESRYSASLVCMKHSDSFSFTSVESTTRWDILAWSNVLLMACSTREPSCYFTNSDASFPNTPCPSATAKKCVRRYSPRCGITR